MKLLVVTVLVGAMLLTFLWIVSSVFSSDQSTNFETLHARAQAEGQRECQNKHMDFIIAAPTSEREWIVLCETKSPLRKYEFPLEGVR